MRTNLAWISAALISVGTVTGVAGAAPAFANGNSGDHAQAPAGNNGTIKIEEAATGGGNANHPHPPCQFWVSFFGYDAGAQTAQLEFTGQAPTNAGVLLHATTSWNTDTRAGGNQLDHSYGPVDLTAAFTAAGVKAQPQQGFHVSLTVHVTGSQGSDVKHKVFWVEPCTPQPSGRAAGNGPAAATTTAAAPTTTTAAPTTTTTAAPMTTAPTVLGEQVRAAGTTDVAAAEASVQPAAALSTPGAQPQAPETRTAGAGLLPFTGAAVFPLTVGAAALLLAGAVLLMVTRRRQA